MSTVAALTCLFLLALLHAYRPFFWAVWIVNETSTSPFHRLGRYLLKLADVYVGYAEWSITVGPSRAKRAKCPKCGNGRRDFSNGRLATKGSLSTFLWLHLHCEGIRCYDCGARAINRHTGKFSNRPYIADNVPDYI